MKGFFHTRQSRTLVHVLVSSVLLLVPALQAFPVSAATKATPKPTAKPSSNSVDALKAKQAALEKAAKEAEAKAAAQAKVSEKAAAKIDEVNDQIDEIKDSKTKTLQTISSTQTEVEKYTQEGATLQSKLSSISEQQGKILREMYIIRRTYPEEFFLFTSGDVSDRERTQTNFEELKKSAQALYVKLAEAKAEVDENRSRLVKRSDELALYKAQLDEQEKGLATVRLAQAQLQDNADAAVDRLEAQAEQARKEAAKVEQQVSAALSAIFAAQAAGTFKGGGPGVGTVVNAGQPIGIQGSTGYSTGDHVHLEVRKNNVAVNPQPYLDNGTIAYPMNRGGIRITQGFGVTEYSGSMYASGRHTGIDMAGPRGSIVYAPAKCTVILNQDYGSYGRAWACQLDNGLVVMYGHLRRS